MKKFFELFLFLILGFAGFTQVEMPEDIVDWKFSVERSGSNCEDAYLVANLKIRDGWHINALTLPEESFGFPTIFEVKSSPDYDIVGKPIEPKAKTEFLPAAGEVVNYHIGNITLKQKLKIKNPKDFALNLTFGYQTCDDVKCLFPFEEEFKVKVKGCEDTKNDSSATTENDADIEATGDNQMEMPEDIVDWTFSVEQGENECEVIVVANLKIKDGWHINALNLPEESFGYPTIFKLKPSDNYEAVGDPQEPKPITEFLAAAGEVISYHIGEVTLKQKIKVKSKEDFKADFTFGYLTCDDIKCLFPYEEDFSVEVKGCGDGAVISSEKRLVDHSLWWIFGVSFLSGLIALITPCVFPMIPLTVSFFTKRSKTRATGIQNAVKYGLSIIVIYVLLGTFVTAIFGAEALNGMATNPWFNFIFFLILVIFAISFMGAFEITLPSSWANKADEKADKGGFFGIFFMALALALVSFSCTGPIVGILLVEAATLGGMAPLIGMLGFSTALALPFALFAAFPGWMNTLPKSGGWLNTVKVSLGILELALAFKFLSNVDLALQWHLIERELFIAIWIGIFLVLALYLFGKLQFPNDSPVENLSVGRGLLATFVLIFVIYLIPGMWGAPLKIISAFPPPMSYSESPLGVGYTSGGSAESPSVSNREFVEGTFLGPQNIMTFHDYDLALAHAKKVGKPLMIDFTGWNCVNCRKMEEHVWGEPQIIDILRDSIVIASLHVDERTLLPKEEQIEVTYNNGRKKKLKYVGDKWSFKEVNEYGATSQPYYIFQDSEGNDLSIGSADYENHRHASKFLAWLKSGLEEFRAKGK